MKTSNSQNIFAKILQIGPWVNRIDWRKGHWCGSTYMVVRLSEISSKNTTNVYLACFRGYVGQPLDHIGRATSMPFASIIFINPRTNLWIFLKKISRIEGGNWKTHFFFWVSHFEFFFSFFFSQKDFFCFIPMKISQSFFGSKDRLKFWWLAFAMRYTLNVIHCKYLIQESSSILMSPGLWALWGIMTL